MEASSVKLREQYMETSSVQQKEQYKQTSPVQWRKQYKETYTNIFSTVPLQLLILIPQPYVHNILISSCSNISSYTNTSTLCTQYVTCQLFLDLPILLPSPSVHKILLLTVFQYLLVQIPPSCVRNISLTNCSTRSPYTNTSTLFMQYITFQLFPYISIY